MYHYPSFIDYFIKGDKNISNKQQGLRVKHGESEDTYAFAKMI